MTKQEKEKSRPDFEEEWTKIQNGKLEIKWYYFPTAMSLNVDISKITKVTIARQDKSYQKNWGSNGKSWFACDMKRNFRTHADQFYNVKVDNGEFFQKGFTVNDIYSFLHAMRNDLKVQNIVFK